MIIVIAITVATTKHHSSVLIDSHFITTLKVLSFGKPSSKSSISSWSWFITVIDCFPTWREYQLPTSREASLTWTGRTISQYWPHSKGFLFCHQDPEVKSDKCFTPARFPILGSFNRVSCFSSGSSPWSKLFIFCSLQWSSLQPFWSHSCRRRPAPPTRPPQVLFIPNYVKKCTFRVLSTWSFKLVLQLNWIFN